MIVSGKNKETGKFEAKIYGADNNLFATVDGDNAQEVEDKAYEVQREALASIMAVYKLTDADWNDPLLNMSDEELLAELSAK